MVATVIVATAVSSECEGSECGEWRWQCDGDGRMVDASEVEAVIGLARRTISTQWFTVCAHKEMLDGLDLQLQLHSGKI